ncbi:MAG TPA: hypothetical protein VFS35_04220 [Terrimicrobiaceae bacterium]|nr:hypothetical protein [Terrimicrobiaceae bacterium]
MPWSLRAALAMFIVFVLGDLLIAFACVEGGWEALRHYAWGSLMATAGLIAGFIFSVVCAVTQPEWRRASIIACVSATVLLVALLLFARSA